MKKLVYLLIIIVAGCWIYNKCSSDGQSDKKVQKQVRVTAKTANLRTGPGTNYNIATSSDGVKCQVSRGTVLDVVGKKSGWYKILLPGSDSETAYIKQSLCADLNAKNAQTAGTKSSKQSSGRKQNTATGEASASATDMEPSSEESASPTSSSPIHTSSSTATEDDFEEEVEEAEFIPKTR